MSKQISRRSAESELFYPIMLKQMTPKETKEYHLAKLFELSKLERAKLEYRVDGSVCKDGKPIVEEPSYWHKCWVVRRLKASRTWRSFGK